MPIATARQIGARPRRSGFGPPERPFSPTWDFSSWVSSGAFSVNLVGTLPGNEILLIPILPLLLLAKGNEPSSANIFGFTS